MPCYTRLSPTQPYLLRKSTGPPRSLWDPRKGLSHLEVQHPPPGDRLWCSAGSRGAGSYAAIHSLQRRGQRLCSQYLCYFLQQLTASSWMYIIVNLSQALIFLFYQKLFLHLAEGCQLQATCYTIYSFFFFFSEWFLLLNTFFFSLAVILPSLSFPLKSHASVSSPCSGTHQTWWRKHVQK